MPGWSHASLASLVLSLALGLSSPATAAPVAPALPREVDARARSLIEFHAFSALPAEHQRFIAAHGLAPTAAPVEPGAAAPAPWEALPRLGDEDYQIVRRIASRQLWDRMRPVHQHALRDMVVRLASGGEVPAFCFTPGTDPELIDAFNRVAFGGVGVRFQQFNRWSTTASAPGPLGQGQPTVLTYSFPPDGTTCPTLTDGVTLPSNLFAFLNGIYGTPDVWQPLYAQVFARWSQLCGLTYVYEPNDDGAPIGTTPGQLGVRGDMRLSGTGLDGPSAVLAFNYFPNNGDMVIDTADTFYNTLSSNSLRLRNVLAHEHGHGMGLAHVCPTSQTKLMEPFISVAYDGPQLDDILSAQRHYGDPSEPNDTPAQATPIPAAAATAQTVRTLSCDDRADVDVFRLSVPGPGLLTVSARPIGGTYLEGPQTAQCNTGNAFNAGAVNDLSVAVLAIDGTTVLTSASVAPVGTTETAHLVMEQAGEVFIRVTPGTTANIQAYELDYRLQPAPALEIVLTAPAPTLVDPNRAFTVPLRILAPGQTIQPGSARVYFRTGGATSFSSAPLASLGGDSYQARLPAPGCNGPISYYFQATGEATGLRSLPAAVPALPFAASASSTSSLARDDFETATGWTAGVAGDTATAGLWVRGDPNGTIAQPEDDRSDPGTQCFFTGQAAPGTNAGTADVDGGRTTLLSPVYDLSGSPVGPTVGYWRWYSNNAGAAPGADVFRVDVSADGGASWVNLETVGPNGPGTTGGWVRAEFALAGRIPLTSQVRFRFIAEDAADGSLVEAAIDEFIITACREACRGDFNADGAHSVQDLFGFLEAYFSARTDADDNADGEISVEDIFRFLAGWFGPCP